MAISLAQAKSLCNASELALIRLSTRNEIGKLSAALLRLKIKRARELRDKWTDLARGQRRATQAAQQARAVDANARSAEKAELFGQALTQFEAQLAKLEAKGKAGGARPKRIEPRVRSAGHRADRAEIRSSLKQDKLELKSAAKKSKTKVTKPAVENVPATEELAVEGVSEKPVRTGKPKIAGRGKKAPVSAGLTALQAAREVQGLHITKGEQLRASTAAKQSRLKASGILRIQKSTSAANKRRQAKRDSR
jgi:hypothetical protein